MVALVYCALYFVYLWLFVSFESDLTHWITLVLLPCGCLWLASRGSKDRPTWRQIPGIVGLRRAGLGRAVAWGFVLGATLGSVQLAMSRQGPEVIALIEDGRFFRAFPQALLMMLLTAGFTEELFFRGVIQARLAGVIRSRLLCAGIAALLFGFYHLPYAYLLESWPTHGDLWAALGEGVAMTGVLGFVFGLAYAWQRNLATPILMHASFNAVWASTLFRGS